MKFKAWHQIQDTHRLGIIYGCPGFLFDLYIDIRYILPMIRNIKDKITKDIYDGIDSRYSRKIPSELHRKSRRILDQINVANNIGVLREPPGNQPEKLEGSLRDHWSIRINDQRRVIFIWVNNGANDIQITDYHK